MSQPLPAVGTRETHLDELAIEWAFGGSFAALLADARRAGVCDARDLHLLGRRLLVDAVRLARGEISTIHLPGRLPFRGEHDPRTGVGGSDTRASA